MLVLSRKKGEEIILKVSETEEILVTVVESKNGSARIGITAPKEMLVLRKEAWKRKRKFKKNFNHR